MCCFHSSSLPPEASLLTEKKALQLPCRRRESPRLQVILKHYNKYVRQKIFFFLRSKDFSHALFLCSFVSRIFFFFLSPCFFLSSPGLEFACLIHLLTIFELAWTDVNREGWEKLQSSTMINQLLRGSVLRRLVGRGMETKRQCVWSIIVTTEHQCPHSAATTTNLCITSRVVRLESKNCRRFIF